MKIEFNKVTWYSKLAAVILFLLLIPALTFYIGIQYKATTSVLENADYSISNPEITIKPENIQQNLIATSTNQINAFSSSGKPVEKHSVVRFDFLLDIPDWMQEHWNWSRFNIGNSDWAINPNMNIANDDFSSIYFIAEHSREDFNADTLYNYYRDNATSDKFKKLVASEIFFNEDQNIRIYHLQYEYESRIVDVFYMDNETETIRVDFQAEKKSYAKYGPQLKKFLQNFEKAAYPQG